MAPAGTATSRPLTSQGRTPARSLACGRVLLRATASRPHPGLAPLGTTGDSRIVGGSRRVLDDRKDATMARTPPIPARDRVGPRRGRPPPQPGPAGAGGRGRRGRAGLPRGAPRGRPLPHPRAGRRDPPARVRGADPPVRPGGGRGRYLRLPRARRGP